MGLVEDLAATFACERGFVGRREDDDGGEQRNMVRGGNIGQDKEVGG
jgi:hypothetical protein